MPTMPSKETIIPQNGQDTTIKSSTITPLNTPAPPKTTDLNEIAEEKIQPSKEGISEGSLIEPPFSQYEKIKNTKYTVDFFEIPDIFKYSNEKIDKLDKYSLKENIIKIEDFVGKEIAYLGLEDSLGSYRQIISEIMEKIGKSQNELPQATIWRIGNYIEYLNKQKEAEKLKPLFQYGY